MTIRNVTFDELFIGQSANLSRSLTRRDIELFAYVSGDVNPAHLDTEYAERTFFHSVIGHGFWSGSLFSTLLGTQLPGPGTIYLNQSMKFLAPVRIGDKVTATITCIEKLGENQRAVFSCELVNEAEDKVLVGTATVVVPSESVEVAKPDLPHVSIHQTDRFKWMQQRCLEFPSIQVAVVHPVSQVSISAAEQACQQGVFEPVLVGPRAKIEHAAQLAKVDITKYQLIDVPHSHAAVEKAISLINNGDCDTLMSGDISVFELMSKIVEPQQGLRTDRRMSHCYVAYVDERETPLFISDAAINITPSLSHKADICQNAIELACSFGIEKPRVAVLAAVDQVNPLMPATLDAAALTVMASRQQIVGGSIDGPRSYFNAWNSSSIKSSREPESNQTQKADIFIAPSLDAGSILAEQLIYSTHAEVAGVILGAKVPLIVNRLDEDCDTRVASACLAKYFLNLGEQFAKQKY